jgi:hypothetical protein
MGTDQSASTTTFDTLALLALPDFNTLSEQQVRGIACVWDGIVLTAATAVDLGPREVKRLDEKRLWYPRACHRCTHEAAYKVLIGHASSCEQCIEDSSQCETGRALLRLMREHRR